MSVIALVIFGIILLVLTLYIIFYVIYPGSGNKEIVKKITPLSSKLDILNSDVTMSTLLSSAGSTVLGFFYLKGGDRTSKYYNSFIPILQVENNWFLEISPSPSSKSETAARLRVQTNDAGLFTEEFIELPSIPRQKWVFISVLRDGRRFDVIYDNRIVASQRLANYPVVISSPLSIGNSGLDGSVIHMAVNNKRLTPSEVETQRLSRIDTNGTVLEADAIDISFPGIKLMAECPSGLPCDPITKPPHNNLLQWKTPYA
jgi:hypothetical protein